MTALDDRESRSSFKAEGNRGGKGFTDIHCHCLPGLDDGPEDMGRALLLCRALVEDGMTRVVASPHQLGRFDGRCDAHMVRQAVEQLQRKLREGGTALTVLPGADVRVDERIPQLLESDRILTVGDGRRYLLLELPHEIFIEPLPLLRRLAGMGITAVITHPERQELLAANPDWVSRWREYRPCLQITAASLTGELGRPCEEAAWTFLRADLPAAVATDAHDTNGRAPRMTAAYQKLRRRLGQAAADVLCRENPHRIATGQELVMLSGMLRQRGTL